MNFIPTELKVDKSQHHAYKILISYRPTAINSQLSSNSALLSMAFRIVLIDDESVVFVVEQCIRL